MLERQLLIPAQPHRLWEELTEPERASTWMGETVEWDLVPGGGARFTTDDGAVRRGRIEEVVPGRRLRFRWWPEGEADNGTSEVTYRLEPDDEGTRLTVTERPVPADDAATASARRPAPITWTDRDTRLLGIWARTQMSTAEIPVTTNRRTAVDPPPQQENCRERRSALAGCAH